MKEKNNIITDNERLRRLERKIFVLGIFNKLLLGCVIAFFLWFVRVDRCINKIIDNIDGITRNIGMLIEKREAANECFEITVYFPHLGGMKGTYYGRKELHCSPQRNRQCKSDSGY